jgi:hypothetical protein
MGRELFDYAFKEYARRWAFKHPEPADLFRTMEDASGEDLDWFWRGWFYGTDACDMAIDSVKYLRADASLPLQGDTVVYKRVDKPMVPSFDDISKQRNREEKIQFLADKDTALQDFYYRYARGLEPIDTTTYSVPVPATTEDLDEKTKEKVNGKYFYEVSFGNKGGLVMPIIVEWTFKDGSKQIDRVPVQIWRHNEKAVSKVFMKEKEVASIKLDPLRETADINESNNNWGTMPAPSKFAVFKQKQQPRGQSTGITPMQKAQEKKKGF